MATRKRVKRPAYRRRPRSAAQRRPVEEPQPSITSGLFQGRLISDLSDQELEAFLACDARTQRQAPRSPLMFFSGVTSASAAALYCPDLAPYWFARLELERRRKEVGKPTRPIRLQDTASEVANRMIDFAVKSYSLQHHPDHGGSHELQLKVTAAADLLRSALKRSGV